MTNNLDLVFNTARLSKDIINLAENGFSVSAALNWFLGYLKPLKEIEPAASFYFIEGSKGIKKPVPVGHILKNIEYSKTLKRLAKYGSDDFYKGETAKLIIDTLKNDNEAAKMSFEDLKNKAEEHSNNLAALMAVSYTHLTLPTSDLV